MSYFLLEPDVAGGLGERTVMDTDAHPPRVSRLHYAVDDWAGDELLQSTPCFIITQRLADTLGTNNLSGYRLSDVEVSLSETGVELLGDTVLPDFQWFQVTGDPGVDDFGLTADASLVASDRALEALQAGQIDNCETDDWQPANRVVEMTGLERSVGKVHQVTRTMKFPEMRRDVVEALTALADRSYQEKVWGEYDAGKGTYDDLGININILLDCQVLPDPNAVVGEVVNESEVPSLEALGTALLPMIDELGNKSDDKYLSDPRWVRVVEAASATLDAFQATATMSTPQFSFRIEVLLSIQRALREMVTPGLRGVTINAGPQSVTGRFLYEHEPTSEESEFVAEVESYVLADFDESVKVQLRAACMPVGTALDLLEGEEWAYLRREA